MTKFKKRYVLGEGYPWADGVKNYKTVAMNKEPTGVDKMALQWPDELWQPELPKYRLVLERIGDDPKAEA